MRRKLLLTLSGLFLARRARAATQILPGQVFTPAVTNNSLEGILAGGQRQVLDIGAGLKVLTLTNPARKEIQVDFDALPIRNHVTGFSKIKVVKLVNGIFTNDEPIPPIHMLFAGGLLQNIDFQDYRIENGNKIVGTGPVFTNNANFEVVLIY